MAISYESAARIAHLISARNLAVACLERCKCGCEFCTEAYQALTQGPSAGVPGGSARDEAPPIPPDIPDSYRLEALSPRRRQVAALAAEGLTNPEIGRRLGLSPLTVKNHLKVVMKHLGVRSRRDIRAIVAA